MAADSEGRLDRVEAIVRKIFSDSGDDVCWIEGLAELAKEFGIPCNPWTLPTDKMLSNCRRFVACVKTGVHYEKDKETIDMESCPSARFTIRNVGNDYYDIIKPNGERLNIPPQLLPTANMIENYLRLVFSRKGHARQLEEHAT